MPISIYSSFSVRIVISINSIASNTDNTSIADSINNEISHNMSINMSIANSNKVENWDIFEYMTLLQGLN